MSSPKRAHKPQIEADRALVERLLAGDEAAFESFFEDHYDGLYRFARKRLGCDDALAQEVAQSALVKAVQKLETYRAEAALFTWLCTFCRFELSAHWRAQNRTPVSLTDLEDAPEITAILCELAAGKTEPEIDLRQKEIVGLVHLTLDNLPPHYGRALEWKYIDGLSVREIGELMTLSPKAVESLLTRARESFRGGFRAISRTLGEGFQGLEAEGSTT